MKFLHGVYIALVLGGMSMWASCSNTTSGIGSTFFQSHSNIIVVDTVTARLETVYLDSIVTSGTGTILIGASKDSLSGIEQVSSYLELGTPSNQSIPTGAVYDSLCFMLKPNHYYTGDTTQNFNISVCQLTQLIAPAQNQGALYNTSSFTYNPVPLGVWTGKLYPSLTDSVSVRLSDQFGQTLFSALTGNISTLSTTNSFVNNYLKGLVLRSQGAQGILGFVASDSSGFMRLYYHNQRDAKTTLHTDFKIADNNLQFNHVDADRSNTALRYISSKNKIVNADASGHYSVLQPMGNLAIRIGFPYLQGLQYLGRYVKILSARLTLKPQTGTYSFNAPLPPALSLCEALNYYTVIDSLINSGAVEHGNLAGDYVYYNSSYTYDITRYLADEIQVTNDNNKTSLLLIPPSPAYNTSFQRLVLDSQAAKNSGIQVSVELVVYNLQ